MALVPASYGLNAVGIPSSNIPGSIFQCNPLMNQRTPKMCIFNGVSPCRDQVSPRICNAHAELFGLTYRLVSYLTGDNTPHTKIVTYVSSLNNLYIPLFVDSRNSVCLDEVQSFTMNLIQTYPSIRVDEFQSRMASLLGVSAYDCPPCPMSWLDDTNSCLVVQYTNSAGEGQIMYYHHLPTLHRVLLAHCDASYLSMSNARYNYRIPNIALRPEANNPSRFAFQLLNKSMIFKWTNNPNCVATPLVLDALRKEETNEKRSFQTIRASGLC